MIFKNGIRCYLENQSEEFESYLSDLRKIEDRADDLRRNIEIKLYTRTLIPEARGDVLGLLESCDKVLNITTETLLEFSVEIPDITAMLKQDFMELADSSVSCLENTVSGIRSYFKNIDAVRDYVTKVQFYKKETNKIAERIKRTIFRRLTFAFKSVLWKDWQAEMDIDFAEAVLDLRDMWIQWLQPI
ncbi:MAG: DUF47 family protein [bacterium]